MPPKRTQKAPPKPAKGPAKKKPAPIPPPPPKLAKKRRARSLSEPIPEWEKGITTLAARERKRFKLSRVSLYEDLDQDYIAQQAENLMGESKNSWGIAAQSPIKASRRPKPKSRGFKRGILDNETAYLAMFNEMNPQRRGPIPNCPSRSPILKLSLEIREEIYSYLLVYPTTIMVKSDWSSMERNPFISHALMLVCRQFSFEASSFLFRNNTFQCLIREHPINPPLRFEQPAKLPLSSHSLFRHIIIDCSKTCYDLEWYHKAAEGLNLLAQASPFPVIQALTLVVVPQRVGMSDTALGMEVSPVTFADFMWYPGPFMKAVCRLAPRAFKIVVKKPGKKKLGIEIDLTYLRIGGLAEGNRVANKETLRHRESRSRAMREELRGLKNRFEEVFEDDDWALREGKCELISAGNGRRDSGVSQDGAQLGGDSEGNGEGKFGVSRSSRERSESEERWAY